MEMLDCGIGMLGMPAGDPDVLATIQNHKSRRLSLPNDDSSISDLSNGLKMR